MAFFDFFWRRRFRKLQHVDLLPQVKMHPSSLRKCKIWDFTSIQSGRLREHVWALRLSNHFKRIHEKMKCVECGSWKAFLSESWHDISDITRCPLPGESFSHLRANASISVDLSICHFSDWQVTCGPEPLSSAPSLPFPDSGLPGCFLSHLMVEHVIIRLKHGKLLILY